MTSPRQLSRLSCLACLAAVFLAGLVGIVVFGVVQGAAGDWPKVWLVVGLMACWLRIGHLAWTDLAFLRRPTGRMSDVPQYVPLSLRSAWAVAAEQTSRAAASAAVACVAADATTDELLSEAKRLQPHFVHEQTADDVRLHEAAHATVAAYYGAIVLELSSRANPKVGRAGNTAWVEPVPKLAVEDGQWVRIVVGLAGAMVDRGASWAGLATVPDLVDVTQAAHVLVARGMNPSEYSGPLTVDALITAGMNRAGAILSSERGLLTRGAFVVALREHNDYLNTHQVRDVLSAVDTEAVSALAA